MILSLNNFIQSNIIWNKNYIFLLENDLENFLKLNINNIEKDIIYYNNYLSEVIKINFLLYKNNKYIQKIFYKYIKLINLNEVNYKFDYDLLIRHLTLINSYENNYIIQEEILFFLKEINNEWKIDNFFKFLFNYFYNTNKNYNFQIFDKYYYNYLQYYVNNIEEIIFNKINFNGTSIQVIFHNIAFISQFNFFKHISHYFNNKLFEDCNKYSIFYTLLNNNTIYNFLEVIKIIYPFITFDHFLIHNDFGDTLLHRIFYNKNDSNILEIFNLLLPYLDSNNIKLVNYYDNSILHLIFNEISNENILEIIKSLSLIINKDHFKLKNRKGETLWYYILSNLQINHFNFDILLLYLPLLEIEDLNMKFFNDITLIDILYEGIDKSEIVLNAICLINEKLNNY